MNFRNFFNIVLATAIGSAIGFAGVIAVKQHLDDSMPVIPYVGGMPATVRILVAKTAMPFNATVTPKELRWVEWPRAAVPKGAFTSVQKLFGKDGKTKRLVRQPIVAGEPILASKLTEPGEADRMPEKLPGKMRAVSIRVDAVSGVADFVAPGDRVDIVLARKQRGQLTSSVILQGIQIVAVDQGDGSKGASSPPGLAVTVAVNTYDSQKLALAQQLGRLSLILRGAENSARVPVKPLTEDSLPHLGRPDTPESRSSHPGTPIPGTDAMTVPAPGQFFGYVCADPGPPQRAPCWPVTAEPLYVLGATPKAEFHVPPHATPHATPRVAPDAARPPAPGVESGR